VKLKSKKYLSGYFPHCGIILVGFLAYCNSFHNSFHFDDIGFIVHNAALRDLLDLGAIRRILSVNVRFVPLYSFAIDYHFSKLNVFGYHLTNFIIHILASFSVYWLTNLLLSKDKLSKKKTFDEKKMLSLAVALFFVSHPIQTQAVTYISQRFASLATLFYLISVCLYLKGRICVQGGSRYKSYFVGSAVMAMLGIFTKEVVITLPLTIIIAEFFFFERKKKIKWITIVPFIALLAIIPLLYHYRIRSMFSPHISESHDGDVFTFVQYLLTQFRVLIVFVRLLIFPVGQNLDYDFISSKSILEFNTFASMIIVIGLLWSAFKLRKKNPLVSFGMFWFFVTFSANVVPRPNVIFEHKIYLLSFGYFLILALFLKKMLKSQKEFVFCVCVIVATFSILTFQRNKVWKNEMTLWRDVVSKSPNKSRPHISLSKAYFDTGNLKLAEKHINRALELNPKSHRAFTSRGLIYYQRNKYNDALNDFNKAIKILNRYSEAFMYRANLLAKMGQKELALKDYKEPKHSKGNQRILFS